jgi:YesN/AraC family two-component response regulator
MRKLVIDIKVNDRPPDRSIEDADTPRSEPDLLPLANDKTGFSILLVEDEERAREALCRMLTIGFSGVKLYSAEDGQAGLELYRQHLPELIITDIGMPQMDGMKMASAIRAHNPEIAIIVMSAENDGRNQLDGVQIELDHYVPKPIDLHKLFNVVGRCIERFNRQPPR